jgi:hypothetical protein
MLRRKFMQLVLVASSSSALSVLGTVARASGAASRNDSSGASRNDSSGASRNDSSGASRNDSSGASRNDSGGASRNDSSGASRNDSSGASRSHSGGSVYCATDANGQQTCQTESSDGLSTVSDSDLDDVLQSFN